MRPRGESISTRSSRYVGHAFRHSPQWTHLSRSVCFGASGMWRTPAHLCAFQVRRVPCRDSSRHLSRAKTRGVDTSVDTARTSACATRSGHITVRDSEAAQDRTCPSLFPSSRNRRAIRSPARSRHSARTIDPDPARAMAGTFSFAIASAISDSFIDIGTATPAGFAARNRGVNSCTSSHTDSSATRARRQLSRETIQHSRRSPARAPATEIHCGQFTMSIADGVRTLRRIRSRSANASAAVANSATKVRDPSGIGNTLKFTVAMAARVPKEPTISFRHVEPGHILHDVAAALHQLAFQRRERHPDDHVARRSVEPAPRPAQIRRNDSAHGRFRAPRRIQRQHLAMFGENPFEFRERHSGFDADRQVARIVLQQPHSAEPSIPLRPHRTTARPVDPSRSFHPNESSRWFVARSWSTSASC